MNALTKGECFNIESYQTMVLTKYSKNLIWRCLVTHCLPSRGEGGSEMQKKKSMQTSLLVIKIKKSKIYRLPHPRVHFLSLSLYFVLFRILSSSRCFAPPPFIPPLFTSKIKSNRVRNYWNEMSHWWGEYKNSSGNIFIYNPSRKRGRTHTHTHSPNERFLCRFLLFCIPASHWTFEVNYELQQITYKHTEKNNS